MQNPLSECSVGASSACCFFFFILTLGQNKAMNKEQRKIKLKKSRGSGWKEKGDQKYR